MASDVGRLGGHCRVPAGQPLDRHVLRLVAGAMKFPVGAEQDLFRLLQEVDRLADLIGRLLETCGPEVVI